MNQFFRRALCGIALIVAAVGTTGCQHESQAEQETVRTVSYRAVMESNKPIPEKEMCIRDRFKAHRGLARRSLGGLYNLCI